MRNNGRVRSLHYLAFHTLAKYLIKFSSTHLRNVRKMASWRYSIAGNYQRGNISVVEVKPWVYYPWMNDQAMPIIICTCDAYQIFSSCHYLRSYEISRVTLDTSDCTVNLCPMSQNNKQVDDIFCGTWPLLLQVSPLPQQECYENCLVLTDTAVVHLEQQPRFCSIRWYSWIITSTSRKADVSHWMHALQLRGMV